MALAKPPDVRGQRPHDERVSLDHANSTSGAQMINTNLRSDVERKYQRDGKLKARSQVIGTLVDMRSKVMYVRVDSGAVVPIDGRELKFRRGLDEGDQVRTTFIVTDDLTNIAVGVEEAVPASAGSAGG
ncbi:MAG TPA: hypothetical protein VFO83_13375 [Aggregicoccus sp.]|nr:hypothetical protein [Aggregicoccus sp.]